MAVQRQQPSSCSPLRLSNLRARGWRGAHARANPRRRVKARALLRSHERNSLVRDRETPARPACFAVVTEVRSRGGSPGACRCRRVRPVHGQTGACLVWAEWRRELSVRPRVAEATEEKQGLEPRQRGGCSRSYSSDVVRRDRGTRVDGMQKSAWPRTCGLSRCMRRKARPWREWFTPAPALGPRARTRWRSLCRGRCR